ncbi:MAG: hydrogenase expression/formation protein HypE [Candidatus Marinimicrobia bacterium]|jgi:hydrogenase expression/formation protein HypE|nr:hydrogenase expression/formation protein HypE [Candidatus Neomarinimicrobiota bacterium]MDP6456576.1 hydrogenase expression/formation protein HypE [Candidatus Neomarinimicrobiota bacterium]MDP6593114.1 hydrogenase expression/formation protein HypE [Candidatus Neomarinimicrobiota bacterium]MDP6836793.1 hydrogenase expression/formation protein HypE [Candidatus Neomarinimicrobiota bacterium]|tara:strand:- start:7043 stop:8089 length:1047 start_codon:yes stop_codon:yes gene_type:complete
MDIENLSCPLPIMDHDTVQLAHGAGGKLSSQLIEMLFLSRFSNKTLDALEDQAVLEFPGKRLSFSTDTFVVDPIFFPGGTIGELAINGTVNDVAMCGAEPLYLSVGFILEEGLPMELLHRILVSMEAAAKKANITIVTGDTKVVNKGSADKIFINTTGIGVLNHDLNLSAGNLLEGDKIILSGTLADHGMAVMTSREGLSFQTQVKSDTAALNGLVKSMLKTSDEIHAMRDPTRGGAATTLNEFAGQSSLGIEIYGEKIPVRPEVQGACEVLGIDPLYVANEGKLIAVVAPQAAKSVLATMQKHEFGKDAVIIGEVVSGHPGIVTMKTGLGAQRIVDMPVGEQLPRIC